MVDKFSQVIMGVLTFLSESRDQIWEPWGWLSLALFLLIPVSKPRNMGNEADVNDRQRFISLVM